MNLYEILYGWEFEYLMLLDDISGNWWKKNKYKKRHVVWMILNIKIIWILWIFLELNNVKIIKIFWRIRNLNCLKPLSQLIGRGYCENFGILKQLNNQSKGGVFNKPVDPAQAGNYYEVIKRPMNLS